MKQNEMIKRAMQYLNMSSSEFEYRLRAAAAPGSYRHDFEDLANAIAKRICEDFEKTAHQSGAKDE